MIKSESGFLLKFIIVFSAIILSLNGCAGDEGKGTLFITAISPSSKAVNMPGFTLRVTGAGFTEYSRIYFNDIERETRFINENELSCMISSDSIAADSGIDQTLLEENGELSDIPVFVSDGGRNFSEIISFRVRRNNVFNIPALIAEGSFDSFKPSIEVDENDQIYIIYDRYEHDGEYHLSLIRSGDGGDEWSEPVDIYTSDEKIYNPSVVTFGEGKIYVTFFKSGLFFSSSDDSGITWSPPLQLISYTSYPIESKIETDSEGNLYILWLHTSYSKDTGVYYLRSVDGGNSFSKPLNISSEKDNFSSVFNPAFEVEGNFIYAAWGAWPLWDSRYGYVYTNFSENLGQTWRDVDRSFGVCSSADFATGSGNTAYIVLSSSYMPDENQIVCYKSSNKGVYWGSRINVTSDSNDTYPVVRIDIAGNINIIYKNSSGCYYVRSINGGDTWTNPLFVTDKIGFAYRQKLMDMAIDSVGNMYIVSEFAGTGELYFTKSE